MDEIQKLQREAAEILARISNAREWIQATDALKQMIALTPDPADHAFVYQIWIAGWGKLYPNENGRGQAH